MGLDEVNQIAMELILAAGDSKSKSMLAIQASRELRFSDADVLIEEAREEMVKAHHYQTDLIQGEARGERMEVSLLMVHAQDHLTSAMLTLDNAKEMKHLYTIIDEIKNKD